MKVSIKLDFLDPSLVPGATALAAELGYKLSRTGTPVYAAVGDTLSVERSDRAYRITYRRKNEFFRAFSRLSSLRAPVSETGSYDMLCYMADMSRNAVFNIPAAKKMLRLLAACGYDSLMLYTEDTYEVKGYPYFGHMRGRFSEDELREIDDYAFDLGIEVIPCIQTLAHLTTAIRWPGLSSFSDTEDILMVGDDRTYTFIRACLDACARVFRSRRVNIGMDEAHRLGLGRYLKKNGFRDTSDIMLEHLDRVAQVCADAGFAPMMWSDMFFRMAFGGAYRVREGEISPEIMAKVPSNVTLVYWDYYSLDRQIFDHMLECHQKFDNPTVFAGGAWKWSGFAPHNNFSLLSTKLQLDSCAAHGIGSVIVTAWGDNGGEASQFSTMPTVLYFAERLYSGHEVDDKVLDARARDVFGASYADLLLFDLPNLLPGTEAGKMGHPVNPCKYLLYNDVLEGLLDRHLDPAVAPKYYAGAAHRLLAHANDERWGYVYSTLGLLCDLLADKCDLGLRLTAAYRKGDRDAMRRIAHSDIPTVLAKLDAFTGAFRRQWYSENKTFGFATQEQRLGGLGARLRSAAARIDSYLAGECKAIEELEQPRLYVDGRREDDTRSPYISYNNWAATSTACLF